MANNDQANTPRRATEDDADGALTRFLSWMRAAFGPSLVPQPRRPVDACETPIVLEPADLGLPLLIISPGMHTCLPRRAARPIEATEFSLPENGSTNNPHEDLIRRRFKL